MQPHLVRWDREYRDQGLTILYVADGRRITPEALMDVMRADGADFPVLYDPGAPTTQNYQVRAFPTAYVIGSDGRVTWEGIPHFDPGATEEAIRSALGATRPSR
jgi:hypothetical protein